MMAALFRHCSCFRTETEDIQVLDYRHCSLKDVPDNVFTYERTLEELNLDANEIKDLPRPLFHCHGLKILNLNDNDIESLPPAIAGLINLEELDVSHNSILNFPDNIKGCKHLSNLNASVNPLGKLPDGLTQLVNLTQLYLNDTFLDFLPANFGRLSQLQILELRENHLKALPKSMARLTELKRLDIGHNDFNELPEVVGSLTKLTELWCDSNLIMYIPDFIRNLKDLCCFDLSMNRIISISYEIDGCSQLHDLYLSFNKLKELPESIGNLRNLTMLKLDENRLRSLPNTIGSLSNLQEFILTTNDLTRLPPSIGLMRNLSVLNMDENFLESLPPEIGSCISLTILSVRTNRLHKIPHELGHIPRLSVLNISDNFIQNLPFSISRLCNLSAIWISENQNKPLVPFQSTVDPETGQRVLTCILLPQIPREDSDDGFSDRQSVAWESRQNRQIKFAGDGRVVDQPSSLVRLPTPYPKEMKAHAKHAKNLALKHHIDLPFEEKNLIDSNNIIANPDVTTSAIDLLAVAVKEAKISKPKSPLLSTMPKSSLPHDPSHTQEFNNLSKTMQFYEAGTMSAQPSNVVNNNLNSMNIQGDESRVEVNQSPRSEIIPNMNMINDPEKIRNSPLMVQKLMINNVIDSCDRGYRSDNDFLYDQSRSMLPTPDGYHSDWEAIGGKMHPANPQFPQKYPIMNSKLRTHHHYESPAPPFVKRNGFDEFPTQQLSNGPNANMQPTILSQPPGHNGMMDYLQQYHVSSIAKNVVRSNQNSPTSSIAQSRISSPSPIPPALQQPRLPLPDYNTALQRSSLYSKFLGPIDTCLAGAPPSYSSIYRVDSQPSSRISHASDSGSAMSSVNLDKAQRSPVSMYSTSYSSPNSELRSEIPSSRPSPPPVLPKPNSSHPSSRDSSSAKNLEEAVYKELNAIHSYASENANLDGSVIMKAVPANIINDVESASQSPINPKDDVVNHLGFTPISPAPNVQMSNQIVRPSLPIQQVPIKNAAGQWIFGSHKNPKVFPVVIEQNPDLGFTISSKNSQYPTSRGIFVESVVQDGPASSALKLGDKILEVDGIDFTQMDVGKATSVLNTCKNTLCLMISRDS